MIFLLVSIELNLRVVLFIHFSNLQKSFKSDLKCLNMPVGFGKDHNCTDLHYTKRFLDPIGSDEQGRCINGIR